MRNASSSLAVANEAVAPDIETLVIGGSQSGLAVSYYLTQAKHPHVVLEQDCIGSSWLSKRWESFTLVTPNWMNRLPGFPYRGPEPDGFLSRREIVAYLETYASSFGAPLQFGTRVERLSREADRSGYRVETNRGLFTVPNIVVATGFFHRPKAPAFASRITPSVTQLHSSEYRNPGALPAGAVLVVGSGQSGCQIAEELQEAGRQVFLSVGDAPREPRRYRGRDINHWFAAMGGFDKSFEDPANPVERYRANPHCSGKNGGHAINLWKLAESGITLLGRVADARDRRLLLAADLREKLAKADHASAALMKAVDDYIAARGLTVPEPDDENTDDGRPDRTLELNEIPDLDLAERGIGTIVWATGFACDFDWIDLPILDSRGYPQQQRGVTGYPGLYFCGLHWMHSLKSGLFFGVGEGAQHVTRHLLRRSRSRMLARA